MDHHQRAVVGQADIEFAHVRPGFDRRTKRTQGVLGKTAARSAMGYVQQNHLIRSAPFSASRAAARRQRYSTGAGLRTANRISLIVNRLAPPLKWAWLIPYSCGDGYLRSICDLIMTTTRLHRGAKSYMRFAFTTPAAFADDAGALLVSHGARGCALVGDARMLTARRRTVPMEAFFDNLTAAATARITRVLASAGMLADGAPETSRIVDPGWSTLWQASFKPFAIGQRFLIVPPWAREYRPGRETIVIQPGQGFGTGHHASTYGMLRMLEQSLTPRAYLNALDIGTGSGILAIAMKLLGVRRVTGIDIDPVALENARENASLNHLARKLRFSATPLASVGGSFDLITANILSSTLVDLAPAITRLLAPGGRLILSGILAREARRVLTRYRPQLKPVASRTSRGWTTLVLGS